jgi:very-short-patch-repair endonuclease
MASHADELIAALAEHQHGVVTRTQLIGGGVSPTAVAARVRAGRLCVVHRGVYVVGPVRMPLAKQMAAVLACGQSAALSHVSAAVLWRHLAEPSGTERQRVLFTDAGVRPTKTASGGRPTRATALRPTEPASRDRPSRDTGLRRTPLIGEGVRVDAEEASVDVAVCGRDCGHRPGIRVHRVASLEPGDVVALEGIPITTPVRTLIDLASVIRPRALEQAIAQAERNGLVERDDLRAAVAARARRSGNRVLRSLLEEGRSVALTLSEAEDKLLDMVRKVGLPEPATNAPIGNVRVDFFWPRERLVVEVDGFAFHSSRREFESDRRRDAMLTARGLRVMRVTWRQIVDEPETVLVRIAQALARSADS